MGLQQPTPTTPSKKKTHHLKVSVAWVLAHSSSRMPHHHPRPAKDSTLTHSEKQSHGFCRRNPPGDYPAHHVASFKRDVWLAPSTVLIQFLSGSNLKDRSFITLNLVSGSRSKLWQQSLVSEARTKKKASWKMSFLQGLVVEPTESEKYESKWESSPK